MVENAMMILVGVFFEEHTVRFLLMQCRCVATLSFTTSTFWPAPSSSQKRSRRQHDFSTGSLATEPQPPGKQRRSACPGMPNREAQRPRCTHSRSGKISASFILLKRGDPGIADLLSCLTLWPHDQERQLRGVEEAIADTAHHPAFQPMPTMGGDGNQVEAPVVCGSLPLCSRLCLAQ